MCVSFKFPPIIKDMWRLWEIIKSALMNIERLEHQFKRRGPICCLRLKKNRPPRKKIDPQKKKKSTPQKEFGYFPMCCLQAPKLTLDDGRMPRENLQNKNPEFFLQVCKEQAGLLRELCHGHDPPASGSRYYLKNNTGISII